MDKEVPAAEADGMAEQIARLLEVDDLQARIQVDAFFHSQLQLCRLICARQAKRVGNF